MQKFKTESKKLLDLMANSIYTNRDIFLRELISNASDAIDKLAFKSLTDTSIAEDGEELEITIAYDKDARTITISDNGIGMTEAELEENLGTIAHSGSEEFKEANAEAQGSTIDIIGQFGVGFYSAFMVAKNVRVISRAAGSDETFVWESDGVEGYTIEPAAEQRPTHGTDVILTLRDEPEATEGDEEEDGGEGEVKHRLVPGGLGVAHMLPPDDGTGATVHHEVGPLVDEGDVVERRFWKEGGEREYADERYAYQRVGIVLCKMIQFRCHVFLF